MDITAGTRKNGGRIILDPVMGDKGRGLAAYIFLILVDNRPDKRGPSAAGVWRDVASLVCSAPVFCGAKNG
ncbi:MAG: hypothetical protein GX665_12650 [Gammaproteobacteria bacterium]|nr:hypothetical protein [Gammaproteobacteria bacterium]